MRKPWPSSTVRGRALLFLVFWGLASALLAQASPGLPLPRVHLLGARLSSQIDLDDLIDAKVVRAVDGDTLWVEIAKPPAGIAFSEAIRLLGVDTPETVHPRKPVESFGREASAYTEKALLGKEVKLAFDWDVRDRYGRLLAYVYLADGSCFNASMLRDGYAFAYLSYPFAFMEEFKDLEKEARASRRGLWAD